MTAPTVRRRTHLLTTLAAVVLLALGVWAAHHVVTTIAAAQGYGTQFGLLFTAVFVFLAAQTVLYHLERPYTVNAHQQDQLDTLRVTVPVPVYNEDPELLRRCLQSLLAQERLPNRVHVVDDGSPIDYTTVRDEFIAQAAVVGVEVGWTRTQNRGKRHAQGLVFAQATDADVFVTVDSDALLPANALEELLKPFADARITSVAGVVMASNATKNLLTRFTDLWFVTTQLVTRSTQSTLGAVLVNSGPLAAYRAEIVRDNLDSYLHETFLGRAVAFSDDSMLTLFAQLAGRTVQQPTAVVLSAMPETVSHHLRQYVRWMRGSFIRSWWRFQYLPMRRVAFWLHAATWTQMLTSTLLFGCLFILAPATATAVTPMLLVVPLAIGLAQAMRYLTMVRSDETLLSRLTTVTLSPVATLWSFIVLRAVRWYGIATCRRTGWLTRQQVEVTASDAPALPAMNQPTPITEVIPEVDGRTPLSRSAV